ncbi:hypothetical protein BF49_2737 [Bradyrhizobium sp.]|nr:hypothetical protein BF49_2737 [Bradyrhizobium sp.]
MAVSFDRALCRSERVGDLLVDFAPNDKVEDLSLARRQFSETSTSHVQYVL